MASKSYIDAFIPAGKDQDACINCGICLQKCPVMQMGKEESKAEIKRLLNGEQPERVLNECTFCMTCNHYCPQELKPYALIMERMNAKNREGGKEVPAGVKYMFTGDSDSGYFLDQYKKAPEAHQAILDKWTEVPEKSRDTLFIGCFGRTIPHTIEYSKALSGLAKYAPRNACCGEIPYRFGDYDAFTRTVDRTYGMLTQLDTERLVCYCGSCSNFYGNMWPAYHGVELPFEVISIWDWLWEKVQAGDLQFTNKLEGTAAINDSCYSSELGESFYDAVYGLHEAAGLTLAEPANTRQDSLCCGFASGFRNNWDHTQAAQETQKRVDQLKATAAPNVYCYCPGCYAALAPHGKKNGMRIHFSINRILQALGDDPPTKN
ncbi:(Fe-S)-binding protein [Desulfatibacillum aliphaticivorans]|uniref:(Fe-S)-binding protein n=1 Tax=Desulfatibacillum aliphaticivorans TaxID=218208 RepID=UPI00041E0960|nr:(Fe-S)-binding protein [Desulfatibacillum aliphaticivorans]